MEFISEIKSLEKALIDAGDDSKKAESIEEEIKYIKKKMQRQNLECVMENKGEEIVNDTKQNLKEITTKFNLILKDFQKIDIDESFSGKTKEKFIKTHENKQQKLKELLVDNFDDVKDKVKIHDSLFW